MSGDAAKNMFSGASTTGGPSGGSTAGFGRYEEREEATGTAWGPNRGARLGRGVPYDLVEARSGPTMRYKTTTDRVMDLDEASDRLKGIMEHCGLRGANDGLQYAFHMAMLVSMAKNSSSVLQPGRAYFQIEGSSKINLFQDVISYLGEDTRRFFRAYADLTREEIRRIIAAYREGDERYFEDVRDFEWVAEDRGLRRYPTLIADGADACSGLTMPEHAALRQAKLCIFANTRNMVDLVKTYRTTSQAPALSNYNPQSAEHAADHSGQHVDY